MLQSVENEPVELPALGAEASALRAALTAAARNLAFGWHPALRDLFAELDPELWERLRHNPVALIADATVEAFERVAADPDYVARLAAARATIAAELAAPSWWQAEHGAESGCTIAYFSCEFALDESLPVYSGGLGVLAGDHLKSASELGVPIVGVGLFYKQGYFRQTLDAAGWQVERYPTTDPERVPLTLERRLDGAPVRVHLDLAGEPVTAQIWRADVGRVRLYLLDTDIGGNSRAARAITDTLYGGDREHRIRQEVLLGRGGVRALDALGITATVFHMNEGHSAFLAVERLRHLVTEGYAFGDALERVRASTVFTTHTPVPAGNEAFEPGLVYHYLAGEIAGIGLGWDEFLALSRIDPADPLFGMTPLALRMANHVNGVSALHAEVSRQLWHGVWPDRPLDEVPIRHVTNGVHARTWLAPGIESLLREAGVDFGAAPLDQGWHLAGSIPDADLWRVHRECKESLLAVARRRFDRQLAKGGSTFELDPDVLTIGFARRFATYKRADLLLSDLERLTALFADRDRPLQLLFAGKAHPADEGGKALIRKVVEFARDPAVAGRVVFLTDYELTLARHLVQGVDVWLNTPRRPLEASGTSGMKAAINGVLNCSILDGWWVEGYSPEVGFAIGTDEVGPSAEEQDRRDSESLFRVLEEAVIPLYYSRGAEGRPDGWIALMKASIAQLGLRFNAQRMVAEYAERYYIPAHRAERAHS